MYFVYLYKENERETERLRQRDTKIGKERARVEDLVEGKNLITVKEKWREG